MISITSYHTFNIKPMLSYQWYKARVIIHMTSITSYLTYDIKPMLSHSWYETRVIRMISTLAIIPMVSSLHYHAHGIEPVLSFP